MATATKKKPTQPVLVEKVEPLDYVDEKGVFDITVQLGACISWGKAQSGEWKRDKRAEESDREMKFRHFGRLTDIGPIDGKTVNGCIENHNRWLKANRENDVPRGLLNRQFLVVDIRPSDERLYSGRVVPTSLDTIKDLVEATVRGVLNDPKK